MLSRYLFSYAICPSVACLTSCVVPLRRGLELHPPFTHLLPVVAALVLLLTGVGQAQPAQVRQTDSSCIETRFYPGGREEKELLRGKDLVYWRFYQGNTPQLTSAATFTKADRPIGRWMEYDLHGKLLYVIDRDRGTWRVASRRAYPFFALQRRIKARTDSLVAATYGRAFLRAQAIWNVQGSAMYNAHESGNWTDSFAAPPTRFLLRYDVRLDAQHVYPQVLQLDLDSQGRFLLNSLTHPVRTGPPRVPLSGGFKLRYSVALQAVRRLSRSQKGPLEGFLQWEGLPPLEDASFYEGHLRFYVPVLLRSCKDLHPQGRSQVIDHFDVYVFDPWTGVLVAKRNMKAVHGWEASSGSSTGLLPE